MICRRGYGAGIEHDDVGVVLLNGALEAPFQQLALDGGAVGLGGATAEVFHVVAGHGCIINNLQGDNFVTRARVIFAQPLAEQAHLTFERQSTCSCQIPLEPSMRRILLVDDELAILLTLRAILELNGFSVETAGSAKEAEEKLTSNTYDMVITDMRMETETAGYDVIRVAKAQAYDPATAILTAYPALGSDWQSKGAQSLLVKPVGTNELLQQLEALLARHQAEKLAQPQRAAAAARVRHDGERKTKVAS